MEKQGKNLTEWIAIVGKWKFEADSAKYLGPDDPNSPIPHGIALRKDHLRSGSIETIVHFFNNPQDSAGRVLFGYDLREYFSAGLGGYDRAYVLSQFIPEWGWKALALVGNKENLTPNSDSHIEIKIYGQKVTLKVDGIKVMDHNLPRPLMGNQVGLFTWGPGPVEFRATKVIGTRPKAFVVMQFGEPYNALYTEVIKLVAEEMGLEAYRADEVYRPGIILQDIISGLVESEVVIAEITPPNPNVFYELGYAHAMDKKTILLAERGKWLPFDISSYRCIFYDNTIGGKKDVESHLRKHLTSILRDD